MLHRLLGGLFVIAACGGGGILFGRQMKLRQEHLQEGRRAIELLQAQIRAEGGSLPEALQETGEHMAGVYGELFREISAELLLYRGEPVRVLWEEAARRKLRQSYLHASDVEQFVLLGEQLGMTDRQMQETILGRYLNYTENELSVLLGEIREKTRLYRNLGILLGIFLTILLL